MVGARLHRLDHAAPLQALFNDYSAVTARNEDREAIT